MELIKGSLNTFLNAFTYPDRTCYPVASTNLRVRTPCRPCAVHAPRMLCCPCHVVTLPAPWPCSAQALPCLRAVHALHPSAHPPTIPQPTHAHTHTSLLPSPHPHPTPWQDFYNLVDVYLDAVLHPNCISDPRIFAQEGWHYELDDPKVRPPPRDPFPLGRARVW